MYAERDYSNKCFIASEVCMCISIFLIFFLTVLNLGTLAFTQSYIGSITTNWAKSPIEEIISTNSDNCDININTREGEPSTNASE